MFRLKKREMPLVDAQDPSYLQAFRHRYNGTVDKIDPTVCVFLKNFRSPAQICELRLLQGDFSTHQGANKTD